MTKRVVWTALLAVPMLADVRLPAIISDHMLLQRGVPVKIWGWAEPGENVTVQFAGQTATATTEPSGKWGAWLKPLTVGAPAEMTIAGRNTLKIQDVLVGEVWLGSGQSNMQWSVKASNNADEEARNANYPQIRLFRVPLKTAEIPQNDIEAKWEVCNGDSVPQFSAVLYFFGRDLHKKLNVPMGLIQTAYGGTPAQAWTSKEALAADPALLPILGEWAKALDNFPAALEKYHAALAKWEADGRKGNRPGRPLGPGHAHQPSGLYNAMVYPLLPYAIKGAIWYQGESNASKIQAPLYKRLFETMIQDWRDRWGQGDFPFLWVQLANFAKAGSPEDWVIVQEGQTQTLELKRTGQAVINDIGDPVDIHPRNKQDVGARLALAARHIAYGEQLVYSGPRFRTVSSEGGAKLRVWFDSVGGGLEARGGGQLKGFEVAGADGIWQSADARVDGPTVVVSSSTVNNPKQVRYAWASNPDCNLINAEGLPAGVFRGSLR
ncbi:MAG: sialate O-acetylesterase [Bryobacterales bacterium]|nr:sialate O-acetylesterase [Bryobacterales bacterium]